MPVVQKEFHEKLYDNSDKHKNVFKKLQESQGNVHGIFYGDESLIHFRQVKGKWVYPATGANYGNAYEIYIDGDATKTDLHQSTQKPTNI